MFTDHEAGAEIDVVLDRDLVVGRVAVTEIAGALTAAAVVALVLIVRARAGSHVLAANLRTGKKTAVPNQGKNNFNFCYYKRQILRVIECSFFINP